MRTRILFVLMVALLMLPVAAAAQDDGKSSVSFDSAFAPVDINPGITWTAPMRGWADLYAHTGLVSVAEDGTNTQTTQAGIRAHTPRFWKLQPFVNIGFNHLRGTAGYDDVLALKVQPGVRYHMQPTWGFEFRTPPFHIHDVIESGNPYDRHTRAVIALFGEF